MPIATVITGGRVVQAHGTQMMSIGITANGQIAGLYLPGMEPEAAQRIDATGELVLPGVIDMHSHHR